MSNKANQFTNVFLVLLVCFLASAFLSGCAGLQIEPAPKKLVLEQQWVRQTYEQTFLGGHRLQRMAPVISGRYVIQGNSIDGIAAYDKSTAQLVWKMKIPLGVESGATVAAGQVYFGASDGQFYCLDLDTGRVSWTFPLRAETLSSPSVHDGIVYVQNGADAVYALESKSGKQLWMFSRQATSSLTIRATTQPVVAGEFILAGFSDGFVVALRKRDGQMQWDRKISKQGRFLDVDSTPVVEDKNIYVSSFDGSLYKLKLETGDIVWQLDRGGYTSVTIEGDQLFYATSDGHLVAIDKESSKTTWSRKLQHGIGTQPVYYKGYLIYGESSGALAVADARSGNELLGFKPGEGVMAKPAVEASTSDIYFLSGGGNLWVTRLKQISLNEVLPWNVNRL